MMLGSSALWPLGIGSSEGRLLLQGINTGQTWLLPGASPQSFWVINDREQQSRIGLTVIEAGAQPVDPSWILLVPQEADLSPKGFGRSDLYIRLPAGQEAAGSYEAVLEARELGTAGSGVKIQTAVRIPLRLEISGASPASFYFSNREIGAPIRRKRKYQLKNLAHQQVVVVNAGPSPVRLRLRFVPGCPFCSTAGAAAGNPDWGHLKKSIVDLGPGQSQSISGWITVPAPAVSGPYELALEAQVESKFGPAAHLPLRLDVL